MTPSSLSVRHLSSATAERPFTRAGPMVRIRFPPAKSQQQTRFRHLRHEGFRAKLKMPAGSSTALNLPIQPYAAPPTCGRSLRPASTAHVRAHTCRTRPARARWLSPKLPSPRRSDRAGRLPAGANRRVGLAPTGKRRLVTAHTQSGRSCLPTPFGTVDLAPVSAILDGATRSRRER